MTLVSSNFILMIEPETASTIGTDMLSGLGAYVSLHPVLSIESIRSTADCQCCHPCSRRHERRAGKRRGAAAWPSDSHPQPPKHRFSWQRWLHRLASTRNRCWSVAPEKAVPYKHTANSASTLLTSAWPSIRMDQHHNSISV